MAKSPNRFSYTNSFKMPLDRGDIGARKSDSFISTGKERVRRPNFGSIIDDAYSIQSEISEISIQTPSRGSARKSIVSRAVQRSDYQNSPKSKGALEDFSTEIEAPRQRPEMYVPTYQRNLAIETPNSILKKSNYEDLEKQYDELYKEFTEGESKRSKILENLADQLHVIQGKYQKISTERENERTHWEKYIDELEGQINSHANTSDIKNEIEVISKRVDRAGEVQTVLLQKLKL